ncbi:MAG TPA: GntR family transcriptional regulator [Firmicutes bacterium]|nr:GntR family transcriptional regulator [Bacillota bacterium]
MSHSRNNGLYSEHIYEDLKRRIITGEIAPGTLLSQGQLAKDYGVSRTPVRDALQRLEQDQLVSNLPKKGALVRAANFTEAVEVTRIRQVLEAYAVRAATVHLTAERRKELAEHLARMAEAMETEEIGLFYDLERQWHEELIKTAGNRRLEQVLITLVDPLCEKSYRSYIRSVPDSIVVMYEDHNRIFKTMVEKDAEAAGSLMAQHVERMVDAMLFMAKMVGNV